jgi:hypothetical protein
MSRQSESPSDSAERRVPVSYEPPLVERVLTPAELAREILYAGQADQTPDSDGG